MTTMHRALCLLIFGATLASAANAAVAADTLYDQRFKHWTEDAKKGDPVAEYNLGNAYLRGNEVNRDVKKALRYLRKSVAKDYAKAEYKLGYLYFTGRGVRRDYDKAFELFQKSAQQDYSPGEFYLGKCYSEGKGTQRDLQKALFWVKRATQSDYYGAKAQVTKLTAALASENAAAAQPVPKQPAPESGLKSPPPVSKAQSVPAAARVPASKTPETRPIGPQGLLVSGNWINEGGLPSRHMPSALTTCGIKHGTVTCRTKPLKRASVNAQVTYMVESTFRRFQENGRFMGFYRTRILAVAAENARDPNASASADIPKVGWQGRTAIRCSLKDKKHIDCVNDNFRFEHFIRK